MRLDLAPPYPPAAVGLLALAAIACAVAATIHAGRSGARRPWPLAVLRAAALAAIALLLLGPVVRETPPRPSRPATVAVLLDGSRSMRTPDVGGLGRIEAARRALLEADLERALRPARVETWIFDRDARRIGAADLARIGADGAATAIGRALRTAIASTLDLAAVIVLSDGRQNAGEAIAEAAERARSRRVPVHAVALGAPGRRDDLAVVARPAAPYALAGTEATIDVTVYGTGIAGRTVRVELLGEEGLLGVRPLALGRAPQTVSFAVPTPGTASGALVVRARVDPLPGEADPSNNEAAAVVRIARERIRVLLAEGAPTWDATFLLRALRRDARIAADAFRLGTAPQGRQSAEGGALPEPPLDASALARYDVVILGRGARELLAGPAACRGFLEREGAMLWIEPPRAGDVLEAFAPLRRAGPAFPVARLESDAAGPHPIARPLFDLPGEGGRSRAEAASASPEARVLARAVPAGGGAPTPVLAVGPAAGGTAAAVALRGLWRGAREREALDRFWVRLVVWLARRAHYAPGATVALEVADSAWQVGREGTIRVRTREADPEAVRPALQVRAPDGSRTIVRLEAVPGERGLFEGRYPPAAPGLHRAILRVARGTPGEQEAPFAVEGPPGEDALIAADREALERLAAATAGRVVEPPDLAALAGEIADRIRPAAPWPVTRDAGHRPAFLALIGALLALEWTLRRRRNLP